MSVRRHNVLIGVVLGRPVLVLLVFDANGPSRGALTFALNHNLIRVDHGSVTVEHVVLGSR